MSVKTNSLVAAALMVLASGASAFEVFKDYVPSTEVYSVSFVRVDPNRLDDYLEGLKQTWMSGCEIGKAQGVTKDCGIYVSTTTRNRDFNVILVTAAPNDASSDPNQKRYEEFMASMRAKLAEDKQKKIVEGYEEMRSFFGEQDFRKITFK